MENGLEHQWVTFGVVRQVPLAIMADYEHVLLFLMNVGNMSFQYLEWCGARVFVE